MRLIFEWDRRKAASNLRKHKVSFEEAKTIFRDEKLFTFPDEENSDIEERLISIGISDVLRILLVVHTENQRQGDDDAGQEVSADIGEPVVSEGMHHKKRPNTKCAMRDHSGLQGGAKPESTA